MSSNQTSAPQAANEGVLAVLLAVLLLANQ